MEAAKSKSKSGKSRRLAVRGRLPRAPVSSWYDALLLSELDRAMMPVLDKAGKPVLDSAGREIMVGLGGAKLAQIRARLRDANDRQMDDASHSRAEEAAAAHGFHASGVTPRRRGRSRSRLARMKQGYERCVVFMLRQGGCTKRDRKGRLVLDENGRAMLFSWSGSILGEFRFFVNAKEPAGDFSKSVGETLDKIRERHRHSKG